MYSSTPVYDQPEQTEQTEQTEQSEQTEQPIHKISSYVLPKHIKEFSNVFNRIICGKNTDSVSGQIIDTMCPGLGLVLDQPSNKIEKAMLKAMLIDFFRTQIPLFFDIQIFGSAVKTLISGI